MVRTGRLAAEDKPNLKVDYALVPGPLNGVLSAIAKVEASLLTRVSLPLGTSIACVGVKPREGG
jgi:hypothetical protein